MMKNIIYDEMCKLLTEYEESIENVEMEDFYDMLVKIQDNWESTITKQD
ncbi:TPA: hypothetical protein KNS94_003663 [Clostridioides difficile]|nr:hypothetical protein [Clostridioides difficile]HBF8123554.1 hypothetical protein [Clostridioides difficile]HBG3789856.1 hypothetical protein [Clostridioides difficile]